MPFFERYRELLSTFPVGRAVQAVERFEKREYHSLRELGTVLNAGEVNARFVPFEDLTVPITAQAALELCYGGLTPLQGYAPLTKCIFCQYTNIRRARLLRRNRP
eukprot:3930499-Pleurochrysis_carterae.AAC.1